MSSAENDTLRKHIEAMAYGSPPLIAEDALTEDELIDWMRAHAVAALHLLDEAERLPCGYADLYDPQGESSTPEPPTFGKQGRS